MDTAANMAADDLRDMYAMHTLFRREFGLAPRLVCDVNEEDADQSPGRLRSHRPHAGAADDPP